MKPTLNQFVQFMSLVKKHKVNPPEKVGHALRPLIEDIIFDVQEAGKLVTTRIYEGVKQALRIDSIDIAKAITNDYVLWLKAKRKNLTESIDLDPGDEFKEFEIDELELDAVDESSDEINEMRARAPKLKGRALKKRKAKSEIMAKLNKNPQYMQAQQKLLMIANREAKKIARQAGIAPNLVDVSKVIVRKQADSQIPKSTKKKN